MIRFWLQPVCLSVACCVLTLPACAQAGDTTAAQIAAEGQQAMAHGNMLEAKASFEKLVRMEPSIAEAHATLAAICFKLREYDETVSEVQKALKLKPSLPRLDSLLGLALSELGRFDEALPKLEKGFKSTADPMTRRMCGLELLRTYTELGRDADAVQTSLELNKLYPDDPEILYHTGRIYGNYAYIVMEKLHDQAPNSIWMLQAQGEANESQKNYDAALIAFRHVLEIDPHRPGIHYRMGRIYLSRFTENANAEDRDSAVQEFNAELEVDPRSGNAAYELANLAAQLGNRDDARARYEAVLGQFPDFEEALVGLGGVLLDGQSQQEAVAPLERATKLRPEDEVAWYRLAMAERAAGNKDAQQKALAEFQKLHHATPTGLRKPTDVEEVTPQQLGAAQEP